MKLDRLRLYIKLALAAGLVYASVQIAALPDFGVASQTPPSLEAARHYSDYLFGLAAGDYGPGDYLAVEDHFAVEPLDPPLAQYAMALGLIVFEENWGTVYSARLAMIALSMWLAWTLFAWGFRFYSPLAGTAAAMFVLLMPRLFFYSHVETADIAAAAVTAFAAYAFLRGLRSRTWALAAGPAFGLALLARFETIYILAAFLLVWLFKRQKVEDLTPRAHFRLPPIPYPLVSAAVLGPLTFIALWPRMWFDTLGRLGEFARYQLSYQESYIYFLGRLYPESFAPYNAQLGMLATTVPPLTLLLALGGMMVAALRVVRPAEATNDADATIIARRQDSDLLLFPLVLALLLFPLVLALLLSVIIPGIPRSGGIGLLLPLCSLLALLAGIAVETIAAKVHGKFSGLQQRRWVYSMFILGAFCIWPAAEMAFIHPYYNAYFSQVIGGAPGAVKAGLERQSEYIVYKSAARKLSDVLPDGGSVYFAPHPALMLDTQKWLEELKFLDGTVNFTTDRLATDVAVLIHRRSDPDYSSALALFSAYPVLWELKINNVPLATIYKLKN